jgi:isopenicillin-N epimerase
MSVPELTTTAGVPARSLWRFAANETQLNHGSFGGVPVAVLETQRRLKDAMETDPVRWFCELPERVAQARLQVASILGTPDKSLALVPNASGGMSVLYSSLMGRGPVNVATTNHGYGAVVMGARRLARRSGGTAFTINLPLGGDDSDVVSLIEQTLTDHAVDLLIIDQITSATAREFPVDQICEVAHANDCIVAVDGAHAPGVLEQPVVEKADVWVGNLHKFWCSPRGAAALVLNNPDLELAPLIDSWGALEPFPSRFDYQGTLDVTSWLAAPVAWRHLDRVIGWARIRSYSAQLADYAVSICAEALKCLGVSTPVPDVGRPTGPIRLLSIPRRAGNRPWDHESVDALRIPFLNASGIALAFTEFGGEGYMRISTHAYNTTTDAEHLTHHGIPILADLIQQL